MSSDGNTVAIVAPYNNGNGTNSGHVRIYQWNGSTWIQKGSDIDEEQTGDGPGNSVSISSDGNTVAIGAPNNNGNGTSSGHVRIYEWNGSTWIQKGSDIEGEEMGDRSGCSVSLSSDGNTLAIGAEDNDGDLATGNQYKGHVRIYQWTGSAWIQKGGDIDGEADFDMSGYSVSLSSDGNRVAMGAIHNDGTTFNVYDDRGHVRVYSVPCSPNTSTDTKTACDSYTWIDGITYTANNNTATNTLINAAGCDSIFHR